MRTNLLLVLLLAGLSLFAAWTMVPGDTELTLMQLRSGDFEEAETKLEEKIRAGDRSVPTRLQLVDARIAKGDIEGAVGILQEIVAEQPSDVAARLKLGAHYLAAQRISDYATNLSALAELQPSTNRWRELANIALLLDRRDLRKYAVTRLIERRAALAEEYTEIAQELAQAGQYDSALQTVMQLFERLPDEADERAAILMSRLMMASPSYRNNAATRLVAWMETRAPDTSIRAVLAALDRHGAADIAIRCVAALERRAVSSPMVMRELAGADFAAGRLKQAHERMRLALRDGRLPAADLEFATELALGAQDIEGAIVTGRMALKANAMSGPVLLALVGAAEQFGRLGDIGDIIDGLDQPMLNEDPLLAARLALFRGNQEEARRFLSIARGKAGQDVNANLELARLEAVMGQPAEALKRLNLIAEIPAAPLEALAELGRLYLELGRTSEGLALFARLRQLRRSDVIDETWALLAAKGRREPEVLTWLDSNAKPNTAVLADLANIALDERLPRLALAAALQLHEISATRDSNRIYGRALVANRRAEAAIAFLKPLLSTHPELEQVYVDALSLSGNSDELIAYAVSKLRQVNLDDKRRTEIIYSLLDARRLPASDELRQIGSSLVADLGRADITGEPRQARLALLTRIDAEAALGFLRQDALRAPSRYGEDYLALLRRLNRKQEAVSFIKTQIETTGISEKRKEELVYALIDVGGPEVAYPHIRQLAETKGGEWVFAFEDAAIKLGKRQDLLTLLRQRASAINIAPDQRREAAYRLLELNDKPSAIAAFRDLAANAPFAAPDVQQLLFLWGPRPEVQALDWLAARAEKSSGSERAIWLGQLMDAGAADRVVRVLEGDRTIRGDDGAVEPLAAALVKLKQPQKATELLLRAIDASTDAKRLVELGIIGEQNSLPKVTEAAMSRAAQAGSTDPRVTAARARAAQAAGKRAEAASLLAAALAGNPADLELRYAYAEALYSTRRADEARNEYAAIARTIEGMLSPSSENRRMHAFALYRLGRRDVARKALDTLLAERPGDRSLRADYASLLIDAGEVEAARLVLGSAPVSVQIR